MCVYWVWEMGENKKVRGEKKEGIGKRRTHVCHNTNTETAVTFLRELRRRRILDDLSFWTKRRRRI